MERSPQKILFFSRGKGRGHAVPDAAIAAELLALYPNVDITFVSYSLGGATLRQLGWRVVDLALPEDNPVWETVSRIIPVVQAHNPRLVISHEEFVAVPISKGCGVPVVFMTDWFMREDYLYMQCLKDSNEILFLEEPGYYDEPSYLKGRIHYTGFVFRDLGTGTRSNVEAKALLGLPQESTVVLVAPGGASIHTEDRAPLFDLLLEAFRSLNAVEKHLIWVVDGPDRETLAKKAETLDCVSIIAPHQDFTATMVASDLVITKGNRTPLLECEALGIPSISVSFGHDPIDDFRVGRISMNTALRAQGISSLLLRDHMVRALGRKGAFVARTTGEISEGRKAAARRLRDHLEAAIASAA